MLLLTLAFMVVAISIILHQNGQFVNSYVPVRVERKLPKRYEGRRRF